jgi:hypothetical protein
VRDKDTLAAKKKEWVKGSPSFCVSNHQEKGSIMKTVFECETEIGRCDRDSGDLHGLNFAEPEYSTIYAHTLAYQNGMRGMLKIEHHCYLRCGEEAPEQPWVKPQILLEPVFGGDQEMAELASRLHEQFVDRVRQLVPGEYLTP